MKRKLAVLTVVIVLVSVAHSFAANPYKQTIMPEYSDEFDSPSLDPKWSFDNPAPDPGGQSWSLTSSPGFLSMTTTGPTDLYQGTNTAPKMLEESPAGDFQIVSRVLAAPDTAFEHAGILVWLSPTSWVRLIRDSRYNSVYLQTGPDASGTYVSYGGSDVVLRLTKVGSVFEGAYSVNGGASFAVIGHVAGPADPSSVGTVVASTPPGNVFTGEFDYFRVYDIGDHYPVPSLTGFSLVLLVLLLVCIFFVIRRHTVSRTI